MPFRGAAHPGHREEVVTHLQIAWHECLPEDSEAGHRLGSEPLPGHVLGQRWSVAIIGPARVCDSRFLDTGDALISRKSRMSPFPPHIATGPPLPGPRWAR